MSEFPLSEFQQKIQDFLSNKFSYKESVTIKVIPHEGFETYATIWVGNEVKDVITGKPVVVSSVRTIRDGGESKDWEERFSRFLWRLIIEMEMHEIKEWFKISGQHYKKPHEGN